MAAIVGTSVWGHWSSLGSLDQNQPRYELFEAQLHTFERSNDLCNAMNEFPLRPSPRDRDRNPRWNQAHGQQTPIILRNATLFDGESVLSDPMDLRLEKGLIVSIAPTGSKPAGDHHQGKSIIYDLNGRFVTPGLVDMHSHHSVMAWPLLEPSTDDVNEILTSWGPITPFVRSWESMKTNDVAYRIIASGGVTSSLILPGSGNIMAGEATAVKNIIASGELGEALVEDTLLEHGIPPKQRHRYMKFAWGENPKNLYKHTRMGNAYILREQLTKGQALLDKQSDFCLALRASSGSAQQKARFIEQKGAFPSDLSLESTVALLRGRVAMHSHVYLPSDIEVLLQVVGEFGIKPRALHHALEAWQVPELLKSLGENITIATFAEFGLYKWEAYSPRLSAASILADHDVPIAFKSDHASPELNAKYIIYQAAIGHSYGLPANKALQAVTSVPARAMDLDYRIGYARPGYDADLVVWDSHPLTIGATPLQVFVDGNAQLKAADVRKSMGETFTDAPAKALNLSPPMRQAVNATAMEALCSVAKHPSAENFIVTGISRSFVKGHPLLPETYSDLSGTNLTLVIDHGKVACLGSEEDCALAASRLLSQGSDTTVQVHLSNGHVLPGITAVSSSLGMTELGLEPSAGNGVPNPASPIARDPTHLDYAKYGVQLEGKAFRRARLGGVTRAVSPPLAMGGFSIGVSVGLRTDTQRTLLDGGVFKDDVALHLAVDTPAMMSHGTISAAVQDLRRNLKDGLGCLNDTAYGDVARGKMPLLIKASSHWDMQQVIAVKRDFPSVNVVIIGGGESPLVASELHKFGIPLILTENRWAPMDFRARDTLIGPPMTPSVAHSLREAGVKFAIATAGMMLPADYRLHALPLEAAWAAKFAGLDDTAAVDLVSRNVEEILSLPRSRDIVIWDGNPLDMGGSVALVFEEEQYAGQVSGDNTEGQADGTAAKRYGLKVTSCWPGEEGN
ncbi:hypothetical protein B0T10DRAFT_520013 [Thelonectria olida]|uniref:Amidohydrolase-related domain-containing protein n=1 Tax=Thelonectria olida TaxID=1576542 RepID=A0A9P8VW88_9HYPO|nr:hypothetical protein B0T10DRAFT_520013 [Thelonectria olida]